MREKKEKVCEIIIGKKGHSRETWEEWHMWGSEWSDCYSVLLQTFFCRFSKMLRDLSSKTEVDELFPMLQVM